MIVVTTNEVEGRRVVRALGAGGWSGRWGPSRGVSSGRGTWEAI